MRKLLAITLMALLFSCQKEDDFTPKLEKNIIDYLSNEKVDNSISIVANGVHGQVSSINVSKMFKDENIRIKYPSYLYPNKKHSQNHETYFDNDENFDKIISSFGSKVSVNGNHYLKDVKARSYEKEETMYIPEIIKMKDAEKMREVNTREELELSWNPDTKNPMNKVYIFMINRGNIDGQRQNVDIEKLYVQKVVDDTGNFKLSQDDLKKFKDNTYLDIVIARGNQIKTKDDVLHTAITTDMVGTKIKFK